MKTKIFFLLACLLSITLPAQENKAVQLLEKAIAGIEADAAVQMTFSCSVIDENGVERFGDTGSLKLSGDSYALLLSAMKLWCDGTTQWSYMAQSDEVYITDADSEEAQTYNPVSLMRLYKKGYDCSLVSREEEEITLTAKNGEPNFDKVVINLDTKTLRPLSMRIFVNGQGCTDVKITSYKPKCSFDKRVYRCPLENFPEAEIVDMR